MTEDREKTESPFAKAAEDEQAKLNEEVKQWIGTAKGIGYGLWVVASMLCVTVGFMGYVETKGRFGDLLIIVGALGIYRFIKAGV